MILDPTLEQMKFWLGVNLKKIDPTLYNAAKQRAFLSTLRALDEAQTPDQFERALARMKQVDPRRLEGMLGEVTRKRIMLDASHRDLLDRLRRDADQARR